MWSSEDICHIWCTVNKAKRNRELLRLFRFEKWQICRSKHFPYQGGFIGFFEGAKCGCEHSARCKSVNMQNRHGCSIVIWKGVLKQSDTIQFLCEWILISSKCTRNIHWPSTPETEVNRKDNNVRKISKRRQKVYACTDIDFSKVLFNDVMFWEWEKGDLSSEICRVSLWNFFLSAQSWPLTVPVVPIK